MAPYRKPAPPQIADEPSLIGEEAVVYGVLASVGVIPVAGALARHVAFHTEATIGLSMLVAGVLGLARCVRTAWSARRRN